ncbi:MAG: DUF4399 domain-containing protein [Acidimicrobiales bacterium]
MLTSLPRRLAAVAVAMPLVLALAACGDDTDDADAPAVSFTEPGDGAAVAGGVTLAMTAEGITIEEAGEVNDGAGHFHVIADAGCVAAGAAVPRDADHVHLGGGQSEGTIYLEPGTHDLCLQVGDGAHLALDATDTVSVEVGITDRDQWCSVVGEVDELFVAADTEGDEYPVRQVAYENIRRLLTQLSDADEQVDASVRDDVTEAIEFATLLATTFADATDAAAAEATLEEVFGLEGIQGDGTGATWILDECGVDIDG